ncbi:NfeD family protein [Marinilabilia salmonicolor]|jgi:membrane-bound ClpP family serine protease|uniref:NfeD-like partner-binding protein n=1 Tax=Marinilabilia salmonicolor TaxID=989 RepID=A0A2T0XG11_9BACT|nr:NfeD family protein [Marinilabilia salmonicolor]PRY97830.1 NfeD-like partner-binding protein [Marinilabilia salmonicolor]RCW29691.1 NfeD-like partner-binding protein [Marinilabilia salmonicolor]
MTIIILLIITGLLLLILEFFVVPGITIAGIGGLGMIVGGIFMAYGLDTATGHITLALTIFLTLIILFYALRTKTWQKLMLSSSINSNVDTVVENSINIGDTGKTITRLNPIGKARINGQDVEARCPGQFLDPKTEIEVTEVYKTYIIVKPVK